MPVKLVTFFPVLMQKAHALGRARVAYAANPSAAALEALRAAEVDHAAYADQCLKADEMVLGCTVGALEEVK